MTLTSQEVLALRALHTALAPTRTSCAYRNFFIKELVSTEPPHDDDSDKDGEEE